MSETRFHALIPMKRLQHAKSRLAGILSPQARAELALSMLDSVLAAAASSVHIDRITVMTSDPRVRARVLISGASVFDDEDLGLNQALVHGVRRLRGTNGIVILPGDLPWLEATVLDRLLQQTPERGAVIAHDHHIRGTSALAWRGEPGFTDFAFGRDSLAAHLQLAHRARVRCRTARPHHGFHDIDTAEDVRRLAAARPDYFDCLDMECTQ